MNFDMQEFAALLAQRLPVRSDSPEGTEAAAAAIARQLPPARSSPCTARSERARRSSRADSPGLSASSNP